ncbi:DUF1329 domain-containing protein [bacterium]|nr:DUF1329 domain-containing protein [bacterium]
MRHRIHLATSVLAAMALLGSAAVSAKVTQEQADRLLEGGDLTPLGGEKAGNADGTIPEFGGGLKSSEAPEKFQGLNTRYYSPWPDDEPEFVITNANLAKYQDKLTPGQVGLFRKFSDFEMPVYKTRRRASSPDYVVEATHKNATKAELGANGEALVNTSNGIPFPIPANGREVIWNHKVRFRGVTGNRWNVQAAVTSTGAYNLTKLSEDFKFKYSIPGITPDEIDNVLIYFLQEVREPARLSGQFLLVHETMDQVKEARRAWLYNPGQRRLRRAPNVGYDNPGTGADGLRTNDQLDSFNGAMDRYTWKLIGKKEIYIPYNAFKVHDDKYGYDDILKNAHVNQDLTRYELHRVWVVEANVLDGTSHLYDKRIFYVDEDSWQISIQDIYDKRGELWRVHEMHGAPSYAVSEIFGESNGYMNPVLEVSYDLLNNRYLAFAMNNEEEEFQEEELANEHFTPANVKRLARR